MPPDHGILDRDRYHRGGILTHDLTGIVDSRRFRLLARDVRHLAALVDERRAGVGGADDDPRAADRRGLYRAEVDELAVDVEEPSARGRRRARVGRVVRPDDGAGVIDPGRGGVGGLGRGRDRRDLTAAVHEPAIRPRSRRGAADLPGIVDPRQDRRRADLAAEVDEPPGVGSIGMIDIGSAADLGEDRARAVADHVPQVVQGGPIARAEVGNRVHRVGLGPAGGEDQCGDDGQGSSEGRSATVHGQGLPP